MLITSTQNPYIKRMRSLYSRKGRDRTGLIPVEGVRFVAEALAAAQRGVTSVDAIFYEAGCEDTLDSELVPPRLARRQRFLPPQGRRRRRERRRRRQED